MKESFANDEDFSFWYPILISETETSFNDDETTFLRRVYLTVLLKTNKMKDGYFACRLHVSKHRPTPKKPDIKFPNIDEITPFKTVISLFIVKLHNDLAKTGY